MNCKPFLKWAGGKGWLVKEIESRFPDFIKAGNDFVYIEPFVGGGAVFFAMRKLFPKAKAVINDINTELINVYHIIQKEPEKLIKELEKLENKYFSYSDIESRKAYFYENRELFNSEKIGELKKSALLIFLNKTCFNGLYRVNSRNLFNVPFGDYKNPTICDHKTIMADHEALQNVVILNSDFQETLKYTEENTFFYFDPPYKPISKTSSFNTYSKDSFNDGEQIRLKKFCDIISKQGYAFLLSNSDPKNTNPDDTFFDALYKNYSISRVQTIRAINSNAAKRGKINEVLIVNY